VNEVISQLLKQGGAIAALVLVYLIVVKVVPLLAKKNGNGPKVETSGAKSPEFWVEKIRATVKEALAEEFAHRNEDIRRIVREEMRYFYGLGKGSGEMR
jgi:hypothetical protein